MTPKNPSIILVRPQLPENIGMVARVMHNFGLKDLIIVSPREKWLNNKSINAAKKATKIIKNIKVYDDLEIALSNFSYVVATTNRRRYLEKNSTNDFKFIKKKIIVNKKTQNIFLKLSFFNGLGAFWAVNSDSPCFSALVAPFCSSKDTLELKIGEGRFSRKHR